MRPTRFRNWLLTIAVAALALVLAGAAQAQPPRGGPHGGDHGEMGGRRLEGLVEQLGLDAATRSAVDELLDASHVRGRELRRELRAAHDQMRSLLDAAEPDEGAIFAQVDVISGLDADRKKNRLGTLLQVRALLPPDARERLLELMKTRERGRHRRGSPPPGAPSPW